MKKIIIITVLWMHILSCKALTSELQFENAGIVLPELKTNIRTIDMAFRIALGDFFTNIQPFEVSILDTSSHTIFAGLEYIKPWTRDAAINCWNAGSFITPDIARNTLLSVLISENDEIRIGGQYWDAIIWVTSAWNHYLATGDQQFLKLAYKVTVNSLNYFEETEFNLEYNLFRGLGWSDGVAAYEGKYAHTGGSSAAWDWPKYNPDKVSKPGYGIPMMALSTNCLYHNAYKVAHKMAIKLQEDTLNWLEKATKLKKAINKHLWNGSTGIYKFYIDKDEESNLQETVGNAYAILFNVANETQQKSILQHQYVAPAGVPCGWPPLKRYHQDSLTYSRHNGVIWPQIQGFWAHAVAKHEEREMFFHELQNLASHAVRNMQFTEIYHPVSGEKYGGVQEKNGKIVPWKSTNRQTWAATAYIRMVIYGLLGLNMDENNIWFTPCIPDKFKTIALTNLQIRDMNLNISVTGNGSKLSKIFINGKEVQKIIIPINTSGKQCIEMHME